MREMKGQVHACMNGSLSRGRVMSSHKVVKDAGQQFKCTMFSFTKCTHPKHL